MTTVDNENLLTKKYTVKEEVFNSITHGVGVLFSLVALVLLVALASAQANALAIVAFSIYGFSMFFLYLSSTLYHSVFHEKAKRILRTFDHISIYLLIAGSYTPVALITLEGTWRWVMMVLVWSIAIFGTIIKATNVKRLKKVSTALYIAMGWSAVIAIKPLLEMAPKGLLVWLLIGGLLYTSGVIFYTNKKIPFNHAIWHLFVLGGSTAHFIGFLIYLAL